MRLSIILSLIFLMPATCFCQTYTQMGAGYVTSGYPTVELLVGRRIHHIDVNGGYLHAISSSVNEAANLHLKVGCLANLTDRLFIEPMAGYSYNLRSTDRKELNTWSPIFRIAAGLRFPEADVIVSTSKIEQRYFLTISARIYIISQ